MKASQTPGARRPALRRGGFDFKRMTARILAGHHTEGNRHD